MSLILLAAALFATRAPGGLTEMTAGQLYDGCTRTLAHGPPGRSGNERLADSYCEAIALVDLAAAEVLRQLPDRRSSPEAGKFCLPDAIVQGADAAALQRTFLAYVDAHPEVRSEEAYGAFEQALAEKWPCPRQKR